jgi:hypothetical protein
VAKLSKVLPGTSRQKVMAALSSAEIRVMLYAQPLFYNMASALHGSNKPSF